MYDVSDKIWQILFLIMSLDDLQCHEVKTKTINIKTELAKDNKTTSFSVQLRKLM